MVSNDSVNREFNGHHNDNILIANEITVNVQLLERCFNEKIDRELGNIVDTVDDRIQNTISTTAV